MAKVTNSMGLQEYMETVMRRNVLDRVDRSRESAEPEPKGRKKAFSEEHYIQVACVTKFRAEHPHLAKLLFAVPNGGGRSKAQGGILKAEGVVRGVSDLLLLVPAGKYHGLCIEMKREKGGRWEPWQQEWKELVESQGYKYIVCHGQKEFETQTELYLKALL